MKLEDALGNVSLLAFDTAPIIYFVEANPGYDVLVTAIFQKIDDAEITGITSVISLCEVLVHPIRNGTSLSSNAISTFCKIVRTFLQNLLMLQLLNAPPNFALNTICERPMLCRLRRL